MCKPFNVSHKKNSVVSDEKTPSSYSNIDFHDAINEFMVIMSNLINNIDEKLVLFIMGACSGGMFGDILSSHELY